MSKRNAPLAHAPEGRQGDGPQAMIGGGVLILGAVVLVVRRSPPAR